MSDVMGEIILIAILCAASFFGGVAAKKHQYRQACGDILVSYTEGYQECKAGK